jgi:phosphoserine aminotransferase
MSAMEMSHRGRHFRAIAEAAETSLRELLAVPDDYRVLFLQGGATMQFAMLPMNLARGSRRADYLLTGHWSRKAIDEGRRFCELRVAADNSDSRHTRGPDAASLRPDPRADYFHYTPNETIQGLYFPYVPESGNVPLVADMSSCILSEPIEVSRFGAIYAGAQKNIGPAGLTVLILRDDLLGDPRAELPALLDYRRLADAGSMLNTPPTFVWYVAGLVFEWLREQGGLAAMAERNACKAALLYEAIDASDFFANPVHPDWRSRMNVPFTLADPALEQRFLDEASRAGLVNLEGHRSVGGLRASLYNAVPMVAVEALVDFMREFERRHG